MFFEESFEGVNRGEVKIAAVSAVMDGDALYGEEAGVVSFGGVQWVSTDEEFVDAFSVGIFDFEVEVETETPLSVATELPVGVAGVGIFEIVFHHLPEFFTGNFANRDGWIVRDDVVEVVHGDVAGRNRRAEAPAIGECEISATGFLASLEEDVIHSGFQGAPTS